MSDNIPFEIQTEIIQRIPDTLSLIRFRSVSKAWKSVIDSPEFVTAHTLRHHQAHNRHHHLLIRRQDHGSSKVKYVSIVDDDDTFPNQKHNVFVPELVDKLFGHVSVLVGTSHGLVCLYEPDRNSVLLWNPFIRKTVVTELPNVSCEPYYTTVVGFGVCPGILDPKLVKITYVSDLSKLRCDVNSTSSQVEVFTLSSGGTWRSPLSSNVPDKSIGFGSFPAVVGGFIFWCAFDRINVDDGSRNHHLKLIMSFDLTSEEFTKVNLPDPLALNRDVDLSVSNLRESLAVIELEFNRYNDMKQMYHVWMMTGYGCTRSLHKLYSIYAPSIFATPGFRKSGAPIIVVNNDKEGYYIYERELAIYEPESQSITKIGIHGIGGCFFVHSYMETLLLLGH